MFDAGFGVAAAALATPTADTPRSSTANTVTVVTRNMRARA
jgi:hypothetical protein